MMVFKRKQIVVLSLVLMIVIAGYLQYTYNKSGSSAGKDNGKIGEAVYVKDDTGSGNNQAANASKQISDYFAQAKIDRDVSRSKNVDALKEISNDPNSSKEVKAQAYEQMMKLNANSEKEMKVETLLKGKGYSDAIALFGDDGSVDIIVKAQSLTSANVASIVDEVSRQGKVEIKDIHVKNVY